ncbi:hypothetical protein BJF79_09670 [Actinomadura sp. CNU-125]|nr:hypothetical protein BJF79_09670 [Actinomadura sp. CNU-125]
MIERLRQEPLSRQAATVVWNPLDAVRDPFDIPCAFGTLYHCRDDGVIGTTMMRSNKPSVMPVNFFEFSLLAELVAAELGRPLRRYLHYTGVLQVPERELDDAMSASQSSGESFEMDPMPTAPAPLDQAQSLAVFEERIRTCSNDPELKAVMAGAQEKLHPYWYAFCRVLSLQWLLHANEPDQALAEAEELPEYFAVPARETLIKRRAARR